MASPPPDAPTLIVGAGPVGLILALALRRHGCPVRIIDQRPEAATRAARAWLNDA